MAESNLESIIQDDESDYLTSDSEVEPILSLTSYPKKIKSATKQRWSPRGQILKSLALASKVKSLALASRPQILKKWPVLGSRTALFFELLKFCEALEKFFGKRFFLWRSLEKFL